MPSPPSRSPAGKSRLHGFDATGLRFHQRQQLPDDGDRQRHRGDDRRGVQPLDAATRSCASARSSTRVTSASSATARPDRLGLRRLQGEPADRLPRRQGQDHARSVSTTRRTWSSCTPGRCCRRRSIRWTCAVSRSRISAPTSTAASALKQGRLVCLHRLRRHDARRHASGGYRYGLEDRGLGVIGDITSVRRRRRPRWIGAARRAADRLLACCETRERVRHHAARTLPIPLRVDLNDGTSSRRSTATTSSERSASAAELRRTIDGDSPVTPSAAPTRTIDSRGWFVSGAIALRSRSSSAPTTRTTSRTSRSTPAATPTT